MRKIGALLFPGFELLDVFGPLEMFGLLSTEFELSLIGTSGDAIPSGQGIAAHPDTTVEDGFDCDILLVPGGAGTRREVTNGALLDWIAEASRKAEFTLGVCTGSALLAKAGVLDGRRATTNKLAFAWVVAQGPKVNWARQARWVEDGAFFTSSGVSAGMDMALGAIAVMHGTETAEQVAQWAEYTWHKDKDHDPFAALNGLA